MIYLEQALFFLKHLPYTLSSSHVTVGGQKKAVWRSKPFYSSRVFVEPAPFPNKEFRPKKVKKSL